MIFDERPSGGKEEKIRNNKMKICLLMLKNKMKTIENLANKNSKARHSKNISEDFKKKENFLRFLNSESNIK